jgi:catechol 2,3-dioxygenase-like lactoylglutathione lyase family enzyme
VSDGPRRSGTLGVHSLDHFAFSVPDVVAAERFYRAFGLDVRRDGNRVDLHTFANVRRWATVHADARPKRLEYLCYAAYADDFDALAAKLRRYGTCAAHARADGRAVSDARSVWIADPDGTPIEVVAGARCAPAAKPLGEVAPRPVPGHGAAPGRSVAPRVRPRRLSHVLLFTPDVARQVAFCSEILGLRLSDRSGDVIAFMHAPHGSDHHVVAFAKSEAPGLHHSSWEVGSVDEIGLGAEHMRSEGHAHGWGIGRHVLGSNYFYYVQDPWGSWAEYSYDIDFVAADVDWAGGDHPLEDSFYVWGPAVPDDFIVNREALRDRGADQSNR